MGVRLQSQSQRVPPGQQQQPNLTPTTSATDLRVNTAAVNVALSSVAKYWVFTNLFPGPLPQVSVYGLPSGTRIENGKPVQVRNSIVYKLRVLITDVVYVRVPYISCIPIGTIDTYIHMLYFI